MLKVTITNTPTEETWTLHGRLVAPWVNELKASWKRARLTAEGRRCVVNLEEVTFIDKSGERMLPVHVKPRRAICRQRCLRQACAGSP